MKRICIYVKDIQFITGKSERQSRAIMSDMKIFYKKEKHQAITIEEFCKYMGLNTEDIDRYII